MLLFCLFILYTASLFKVLQTHSINVWEGWMLFWVYVFVRNAWSARPVKRPVQRGKSWAGPQTQTEWVHLTVAGRGSLKVSHIYRVVDHTTWRTRPCQPPSERHLDIMLLRFSSSFFQTNMHKRRNIAIQLNMSFLWYCYHLISNPALFSGKYFFLGDSPLLFTLHRHWAQSGWTQWW